MSTGNGRLDDADQDAIEMRLHMARWIWPRQNERAPSGKTWGEVFTKMFGMTPQQFKQMMDEENKK